MNSRDSLPRQRRENNYRDYSEEDARTLEKVKLLRQLSLDLEAIRALKEGSLSLAQAMERQAEVLEGDRADLERYAQGVPGAEPGSSRL